MNNEEASEMAAAELGPPADESQNHPEEAAALGPPADESQNPLREAAALGPLEEGPQNSLQEAAAPGPSEEEPHGHPQKTSSPRKIAANRENAKHSTGPRTAEGKAKSACNSLTHGIFAKQLLTSATPETAEEISALVADIGEFFQPVGVIEELLAQKIAVEVARRARIVAFEQKEVLRQNIFYSSVPTLDRLLRYSAAADRGLFRAMAELERLQAARKAQANSEEVPAEEDDEPTSDHKD